MTSKLQRGQPTIDDKIDLSTYIYQLQYKHKFPYNCHHNILQTDQIILFRNLPINLTPFTIKTSHQIKYMIFTLISGQS